MSELDQIIAAAEAARGRGVDSVLATVVRVAGSTYRRPGARMLLTLDGERIGAISGGCLERELSHRAGWLTETGRPVVVRYDTSSGDEAVWEFGLGCQGVVWVLLERLAAAEASPFLAFVRDRRAARRAAWVATVVGVEGHVATRVGQRWLSDGDAFTDAAFLASPAESELRGCIGETSFGGSSAGVMRQFALGDGFVEAFVERIETAPHLLVCGAGHDAVPLVRMAAEAGFAVTVVDGRSAYASAARFPEATRVVACKPGELMRHVAVDDQTFAVVMTHNAYDDVLLLRALLPSVARYVGLLGPRSRAEAVLTALELSPADNAAAKLSRLHAPIGLDLGAETPAEIALAILAEVQAVRTGHAAGFLSERSGPIHRAAPTSGEGLCSLLDQVSVGPGSAAKTVACPIPSRS